MKIARGKLTGIIGTVIIHLIAAIIIMSFKLQALNREIENKFTVELSEVETPVQNEKNIEKGIELPASRVERILQGDQEMLNIARNLANKPEEKIDPADYIDKVKEELIKAGKLGPDNYIDEQKRLQSQNNEDQIAIENEQKETRENKPTDLQKMEANYQGPTRIYYDLAGRTHTYLPIPIYKCQGSGKVVLSIKVNQKGDVEEAQIVPGMTSASDPCLSETAINTAMISRFNPDVNAPKIQTGTITYEFVAQ